MPADGREFTITPSVDNGLSTPRLFDLGIIEVTRIEKVSPTNDCPNRRTFYDRLTEFGKAVLVALLQHVGFEPLLIDRTISKA